MYEGTAPLRQLKTDKKENVKVKRKQATSGMMKKALIGFSSLQ